jgi:hypothetical protein
MTSRKLIQLLTAGNKFEFYNNGAGFGGIWGGNILFVTFLKIFLESTICSGRMVVAPLLMGEAKVASFTEFSQKITLKSAGSHRLNRRTTKSN